MKKWYIMLTCIVVGLALTIGLFILNNYGDELFGSKSKEGIEVQLKNKEEEYYKYFDADDTVKDTVSLDELQKYLKEVRGAGFNEDESSKLIKKISRGIKQVKVRDELNEYVTGLSKDTVKSGLYAENTKDIRNKITEMKKSDPDYYNLRLKAKEELLLSIVNPNEEARKALEVVKTKASKGDAITVSDYGKAQDLMEELEDVGYAETLKVELSSYTDKVQTPSSVHASQGDFIDGQKSSNEQGEQQVEEEPESESNGSMITVIQGAGNN